MGDRSAMRKGGRANTNAQMVAEASFVTQEKSNKVKNATPMYAFTLKKRQNPIPIATNNSREKIPRRRGDDILTAYVTGLSSPPKKRRIKEKG